mmetsp:Transcript_743/g.1767  ORF Transcript_743/g.1767 Transcript_743/m.1767 type:complete len:262 (-) Transcript_743:3186-3971(-)
MHGSGLGTLELLRLHTGNVHLLPGLGIVGLAGRLNSLRVLPKLHVARGKLRVVLDRLIEDLGGLVGTLLVKSVSHSLDVRRVCAADKLLHLGQAIGLGIRVHELRVNHLVLGLVASHEEVARQFLVVLLVLCCLDDLGVVRGILGLEVGLDCLGDLAILKLRLAELEPDSRVVATRSELLSPLHRLDVGKQSLHGLHVEVALLVDEEGFLVEHVRLTERNLGDFWAVVVVQAVDVVHDAGLICLDRCENEQVLQIAVLAEV